MTSRVLILAMILVGKYTADPVDPLQVWAASPAPPFAERVLWCFNGPLGEDCTAGVWVRDHETVVVKPVPVKKSKRKGK